MRKIELADNGKASRWHQHELYKEMRQQSKLQNDSTSREDAKQEGASQSLDVASQKGSCYKQKLWEHEGARSTSCRTFYVTVSPLEKGSSIFNELPHTSVLEN